MELKIIRLHSLDDFERDSEGCYLFELNTTYIFDKPTVFQLSSNKKKSSDYQEVHGSHNGMTYPK